MDSPTCRPLFHCEILALGQALDLQRRAYEAETDAGVHCPSFFGYIVKHSLPVLSPFLALSGWPFL